MTTLEQNLITDTGTVIEDFEDATDWAVTAGASLVANVSEYKTGAQSLKFTSATGATSRMTKTGLSWDLSDSSSAVRLWFYVHDIAKVKRLQIIVAQGDTTTNFNIYPEIRDGWNLFDFKRADWTDGGADWDATFDTVRFNLVAEAGVQAQVSLDTFRSGVVSRPAFVLTFDDDDPSVFEHAYGYMRGYGMVGTFYVITGNVDGDGKITSGNLQQMYGYGWDIANHSQTHTVLTTLTQGEVEAELTAAKSDLDGWGLTRASSHVAYVGGQYDDTVLAAMTAANMVTGRTVEQANYPVLPLADPLRIPRGKDFNVNLSLADAKAWVDSVVSRKEIGLALFHKMVDTAGTNTEWAISDFEAFIDYLAAQSTPVLTITQLYNLQSGTLSVDLPAAVTPDYTSNARDTFASNTRLLTAVPVLLTDTAGNPIFDTSGELVLLTGGYVNSSHATSKARASFTSKARP